MKAFGEEASAFRPSASRRPRAALATAQTGHSNAPCISAVARRQMSAVARRQRSVGRLVALGALMCVVLAVCASSAGAATADTAYNALGVDSPDQQANEIFGQRIESANLGDGVTDVFASSYLANFFSHTLNATAAGQVTLFNGKDRSIRYELFSPEPQDNAQFGFYIQNLGDVNRDGKDDLAVGAPSENVDAAGNACTAGAAGCNANSGKVFVFEGSSGQLLYAINSPDPSRTYRPQARPSGASGHASAQPATSTATA